MKLAVDASWMVDSPRGMGKFARQLLAPLKDEIIELTPSDSLDGHMRSGRFGRLFPIWEQRHLPRLCRALKPDYLLCPYNTAPLPSLGATRPIVVIHDLIFMEPFSSLPRSVSHYQTLGRLYRRMVAPRAARKAWRIVTVSAFTRDEIVRKLGLSSRAITVIPNAISPEWFADPLPEAQRQNYLFTVAGEAPSKNLSRLLLAFASAVERIGSDVSLKIAGVSPGARAEFLQMARDLEIDARVEFLDFVPETELRHLYQRSLGFLFPSLFEGFGIPLIEAMASGSPIACSNSTSLPEVVGDCAILFEPRSVTAMVESIVRLATQRGAMLEMAGRARHRAEAYSSQVVEQQIREFWESLK